MAKHKTRRHAHRSHRSSVRTARPSENYLVVVRGWMLVVAFALMLGIGAVVGNFINQQIDPTAPVVAGAAIER
jgi:hypothetical protein